MSRKVNSLNFNESVHWSDRSHDLIDRLRIPVDLNMIMENIN